MRMKNLVLLVLFFFSSVLLLNGQNNEIPQTQKPLIVKVTASWCPLCGTWGWTFFENIYNDNIDNAVFLAAHHSGDHTNSIASELVDNFNVFGQPRFIYDGVDQNVNSGNISAKRTSVGEMVSMSVSESPKIQTGLDASFSGDQLNVSYSVKLFDNLTGAYSVALYLVEKTFLGYQASVGSNADHKAMLRGEFSDNTFGTMLFDGNANSGDIFEGNYTMSLGNYNTDNLEVVSVIWKKEGNDYKVVNSNTDKNVQLKTTSGLNHTNGLSGYVKVYPTLVSGIINIEMGGIDQNTSFTASIYDQNGRKIYTAVDTKESLRIQRQPDWMPGMYLIKLDYLEQSVTKKIIFE